MNNFPSFLTAKGQEYFEILRNHCSKMGFLETDEIEIAMLANEYDLYFSNMAYCQENGYVFRTGSNNGYSQVRPEFTIMKNSYQNILKHSPKFGMNPADRTKLFGMKSDVKKPKKFDL